MGTIEFADHGEGLPLLVAHGVLGCHVDSVGTLGGQASPAIHSGRSRHPASVTSVPTLPEGATPAAQAEAYALLLDHIGVDRAVVIGFSAGSGSVLEFGAVDIRNV